MLTLAAYISSEGLTNAEFARRLSLRLGQVVSDQNVWRWTRDPDHDEYSIPEPRTLIAIYFLTGKLVPIEVWYQHLVKEAARRPKNPKKRAA